MWIKKASLVLMTFLVFLIALIFRLYYVSFGNVSEKVKDTAGVRTATKTLYNTKGIIYDRNLFAIAGKQKTYYLIVNPREFDSAELDYISSLTNSDYNDISSKLTKESPFVLESYIKPKSIKGVYVYESEGRYPQTRVAEHLLGYLDSECIVGQAGIEKAYNDYLSEFSARSTFSYSANAMRGIIPRFDIKTDIKQSNENGIVLTIDKKLSLFSQNTMSKYIEKGCVVVMDCNNGQVLTLSSTPSYNEKNISVYDNSSNGELINNALVNQTVGSVFKIVVSLCAVSNDLDDFEYECTGSTTVLDHIFSCQNQTPHGMQDINSAFSYSCNCYFISLGQLLGYDKLLETAQRLGLDSSIRLAKDIYSLSGEIPENSGEVALANLSIGQGKLMISPISICRMTAAICNGGYLVNPTVYLGTYEDGEISNTQEYSYKNIALPQEDAEKVKQMCIDCVLNGTGVNAMPDIDGAGGKTASAQTGKYDDNGKEVLNTYFTGFYPADKPKYAITVFAENGLSGSATCAPVFKEICNFIKQNY